MKELRIKRILIERGSKEDPLTKRALKRLPGIPVKTVDRNFLVPCDDADTGKRTLRLVHYNGDFLKPCPGTKNYICCGYQILNVGINCPMDCTYCFLQSYINEPELRVFSNLANKLQVIDKIIKDSPNRIFRIGTGEFTDSLALDNITGWSETLLPFFSEKINCVLELKTKTDFVNNLMDARPKKGIILAWSLNTHRVINREEKGAVTLKKRLIAAQRCQRAGFLLAFHFDPLFFYPGWEDEYGKTVELLERYIDPGSIIWISMGSFRYMPELKGQIKKRHPGTRIFDGEFVPGMDGKYRYFKPIRVNLYSRIAERLKKWNEDLGIYLCMESDEVWRQSLGWSPMNTQGLSNFLDDRVRKFRGDKKDIT